MYTVGDIPVDLKDEELQVQDLTKIKDVTGYYTKYNLNFRRKKFKYLSLPIT